MTDQEKTMSEALFQIARLSEIAEANRARTAALLNDIESLHEQVEKLHQLVEKMT